jgi:twitching motility protein PilT
MNEQLQRWVGKLADRGGTVLHLVPGQLPLARVGGRLEPLEERMVDDRTFVEALHAVCGERDAGVLHTAAGGGQLLHGRLVSDAGRRTLVLRRLVTPETDRTRLGLPDAVWERLAGLQHGLVLVTGLSGSGRSTTCAALSRARTADAGVHALITGEPLTWRLPPDNPRARITHHIPGVDGEGADHRITHALEQDVDVVCCDPVGRADTGAHCAQAAADGLLVIAGVTGTSAADALHRLADAPGRHRESVTRNLAHAVQLILHQALVERADGRGRVLASGVLTRTPAVYNLLREDRAHQLPAMMAVGGKWGMRSLEQHLQQLVADGTVTREAALAAHPEPWLLRDWLDRSAPKPPPPPQP